MIEPRSNFQNIKQRLREYTELGDRLTYGKQMHYSYFTVAVRSLIETYIISLFKMKLELGFKLFDLSPS